MNIRLYNIEHNKVNNKLKIEMSILTELNDKLNSCKLIPNCNGKVNTEKEIFFNITEGPIVNKENIEYRLNKVTCDNLNLKIDTYKFEITTNLKTEIAKITDNKENDIVMEGNQYYIYLKNTILEIKNNSIVVKKKTCFNKIKYEINKLLFSINKLKKIPILRMFKTKSKYYLFNDRMLIADDNATALFEYINNNNKEIAKYSYFVLDKNSKDIEKIKKIGKVLIHKSFKHKLKYLNSKCVISSFGAYTNTVFNPFDINEMQMYKDILDRKFIFTQHGVIMTDVSEYLNKTMINAYRFVTSTKDEYDFVTSNKYLYNKEEVVLTGLPRFDKLKDESENIILISPSWRMYLTGLTDKEFKKSEYYIHYKNLLNNEELLNTLKQKEFKIQFLLHPNLSNSLNIFKELESENIKILVASEIKYSELFKKCKIFITDYSSIHFDLAYLKKIIMYYQYDKEEFFSKHYKKGYYDYEKHGFGEVITENETMINKLIEYINNPVCKEKYIEKINKSFFKIDTNNCQRLYENIKNIDDNKISYSVNNVI